MTVQEAIRAAEAVLPGEPVPDGQADPRWQAIIKVGQHIETDPDAVWAFAEKWGSHESKDLRAAIATCLLEHLLEYHLDLIYPRVKRTIQSSRRFAYTFLMCWAFGQTKKKGNRSRFERLQCAAQKQVT